MTFPSSTPPTFASNLSARDCRGFDDFFGLGLFENRHLKRYSTASYEATRLKRRVVAEANLNILYIQNAVRNAGEINQGE